MTCFTHTCQLCVPTIEEVCLRRLFGMAVVLCWSLLPKKLQRHWTSNFMYQGTLQGGRVEDYRMMFTRHLHLPQSHIQAKLYIYKTDYMMSLYTPTSVKENC